MNTKLKKMVFLFGILFTVACSNEAVDSFRMSDVEVNLSSQILTRVSGNLWGVGDAVGVYMYKYGEQLSDASVYEKSVNCKYITDANGGMSPDTDLDKLYYPLSENVSFIAYYPFGNVENYSVSLDVRQQNNPSMIDFLYSDNIENVTATTTVQQLTFAHQLSKVLFDIKAGSGISETELDGVTVSVRNATSNANFSLVDGSITLGTQKQEMKLPVTYSEAIAHAEGIMIPQSCDKISFIISLQSGKSFFYALEENSQWESGKKYTYEITLTDNMANASFSAIISDWVDGVSGGITDTTIPEVWDGETVNTDWYTDDATTFSLYQPADLAGLVKLVNEGCSFEGKSISLFVDLDMNNKPWTPIGISDNTSFKGTFNGNYSHIKNLNPVLSDNVSVAGLFGVSNGVIRQVIVSGDFNVSCDKFSTLYVGGVCGINKGTIQNCRSYVDVEAGMNYESETMTNAYVGGIVGDLLGTISSCQNYGAITAENVNTNEKAYLHIGGISGGASDKASISDCENMRNLIGRNGNVRMGGIVAIASGQSVLVGGCSNYGNVTIQTSHNEAAGGGIVGKNSKAKVKDVINKGIVNVTLSAGTKAYGGGVVAMNDSSAMVLSGENYGNVIVVGSMADESNVAAGGIVGYNGNSASVHKSTNYASSSASNAKSCFSGGITGYNDVEDEANAYTYDCCSNEGLPVRWIGNADATDDLITTTGHTDE